MKLINAMHKNGGNSVICDRFININDDINPLDTNTQYTPTTAAVVGDKQQLLISDHVLFTGID